MVLDEPATGLDVVTQARLLRELTRSRREVGVAVVYVTHDLGVVSTIAERILVLEHGLTHPQHAYTKALLEAAPSLSAALTRHD